MAKNVNVKLLKLRFNQDKVLSAQTFGEKNWLRSVWLVLRVVCGRAFFRTRSRSCRTNQVKTQSLPVPNLISVCVQIDAR